jgi:hypothetical protein
MLDPLVLGLSLLTRYLRTHGTSVRTNRSGVNWRELVPWLITGFLANRARLYQLALILIAAIR